MEENNDRFSNETIRFVIIFLLITSIFELFMIVGFLDIINDKNNYILNLTEEKQELTDQYGELMEKYLDKKHLAEKYQRKYGDIND